MKSYIELVMEVHPDWPRRIRHGEYVGVLSGVQSLLGGDAAPLYRFPGGECVGIDYELSAVRLPEKEGDDGMVRCGGCGTELLCNEFGDMPDVCPACHEGVDWSAWEAGEEDE